jgi:hypothetical protein
MDSKLEEDELQEALFQSQLEAALQASMATTTTPAASTHMTADERAFFTDEKLPTILRPKQTVTETAAATSAVTGHGPKTQSDSRPPVTTAPSGSTRWTGVNRLFSHPSGPSHTTLTPSSATMSSSSSSSSSQCSVCGKAVSRYTPHYQTDGLLFHAGCFLCTACGKPLDSRGFTMHADISDALRNNGHSDNRGGQQQQQRRPYHPQCAVELFNPHCCLCNAAIEGQYLRHPFFPMEQYCARPDHIQRRSCFACGRKEPLPESHRELFVSLPDGRPLCGVCSRTVIMDSQEAAEIFRNVVEFLRSHLDLPIPANMSSVPVLVVDLHTLNEQSLREQGVHDSHNHSTRTNSNSGGDNSNSSSNNTSIVRGLTLSTQGEIRHFMDFGRSRRLQESVFRKRRAT